MTIGEWIEELTEKIKEEMEKAGLEGDTSIQVVKKANDRELHCLTIKSTTGRIAPVMYLDELWDLHEKGESTRTLAEYVVSGYRGHCRRVKPFSEVLENHDELIKLLRVKLVDKKYNQNYLKMCVHKEVDAGLACIVEARFDDEDGGYYSATITNDLVDSHEFDKEELIDRAMKNSAEMEKPKLFVLSANIFNDRPKNIINELKLDTMEPLVFTTESQMHGTHLIVTRPDVMKALRDKIGNFWVVPSSRHEVLIMAKSIERFTPENLIEMLREANKSVVSDDDFFSDDLFEFTELGLERYEVS